MRQKICLLIAAAGVVAVIAASGHADLPPVVQLDFNDPVAEDQVELNGLAELLEVEDGVRLRLTEEFGETSSVWLKRPHRLTRCTVEFDFEVRRTELDDQPADGFTFTAQTYGPIALGEGGGSLGYARIPGYSYAVEFNTYAPQGLPEQPETVAVDIMGARARIGQVAFPHIDRGVYHASIAIRREAIEVTLSGGREDLPPTKVLTTPWWIQFDTDQPLWFGFTGATGGLRSTIDILNLKITPGL